LTLLANTGLTYRFTGATVISLDLKSVAASVEITASVAALATASPKYAEEPMDTPQTITAVPQEVMQPLKHDAIRRELATEEEQSAYYRGLAWVAGDRTIARPWPTQR